MSAFERLRLAIPLALIGFCAAYHWAPPGPFYYPLRHHWSVDKLPDAIAMGWYGRTLWGLAAALAGGGVGWLLTRCGRGLPVRVTSGLAIVALLAMVGLALGIANHEFNHWGTWPYGR